MTEATNKRNTIRGKSPALTQVQRRQIMRDLKDRALSGDLAAICALSNFELAEATRKRMYSDMDRAAA